MYICIYICNMYIYISYISIYIMYTYIYIYTIGDPSTSDADADKDKDESKKSWIITRRMWIRRSRYKWCGESGRCRHKTIGKP